MNERSVELELYSERQTVKVVDRNATATSTLKREVSLLSEIPFEQQVSNFWAQLNSTVFTPRLIDYIWVADRCIQLNAQQVSTMPLKFNPGSPSSFEPAWLANPDPAWYPNGIADALHAAVDDFYRHGDIFLYMTSDYATGLPLAWTVLPASQVGVTYSEKTGRRAFDIGGEELEPDRVVQISRNPRPGSLRGTSALRAYAQIMDASSAATIAAKNQSTTLPPAVLRVLRKIDEDQAKKLQAQFREGASERRPGEPIIMPPDLELAGTNLGFTAKDLQMIEGQEFNARVLASSCGVPVFLVNLVLTGGLVYQNPAMLGEFWWRTELHATCARFARALSSRMLPRGSTVYFDPSHLTQPLTDQTNLEESPADNASPANLANVQPLRPTPVEAMV
jgi:Phage portal protein